MVLLGMPALLSLLVLVHSCSDGGGHMRHVYAATQPVAAYRLDGGMALPDPAVTPGAFDPEIEADLSGASFVVNGIEKNICAPNFSAKAIRKKISNFAGLKKKACEEYGIEKCDGSVEGDHLISIELGGCPDCLTNIWPEPMAEARIKDHQLEDVLPRLICSGKIGLAEAQKCISENWVACSDQLKNPDETPDGSSGRSGTRNRPLAEAQGGLREGRGDVFPRPRFVGRVPQGWKREIPASYRPVLPAIQTPVLGFWSLGSGFGVVLGSGTASGRVVR
jgi:hypothetical protein